MTNTIEIVLRSRDEFTRGLRDAAGKLDDFGSRAQRVGQQISGVGTMMTLAAAPLVAGFVEATRTALAFDSALTNIRSLTGQSATEFAGMKGELLDIGANAIAGPQAVADAMYDIVSGVTDASTHMAVLQAAINTSEAGAAGLAGTTSALISVMNAYRFSAQRATYVSDVLTRTVGVGVGTMDEFAQAIPTVTGVAAQVGAEFDDVGSQLAYLTTQGYTASVAATQLRQAFVALLNPNEAMKDQLQSIGYESGSAALDALGLVGVYEQLAAASGGSVDDMARSVGSVEALQAVLALTSDGFAEFDAAFEAGVQGATEAAQEIQRSGAAAQFQLLTNQVEALKIRVGDALVPVLLDLVNQIKPVVENVISWVEENPELVGQIAMITGGAVLLGGGLIILGGIINGVGAAVGLLSGAVGLLTSGALLPLLPVLALGAALVFAYQNNILGFRTAVDGAYAAVRDLVEIMKALNGQMGEAGVVAAANAISNELNPNDRRPGIIWDAGRRQWIDSTTGMPSIVQYPAPPGRAIGGPVASGGAYMVGETGPEVFVPASAGRIIPNEDLGGGSYYTINVMMPAAALAAPGAANAAGETFGDAIARRLRELG